MYVNFAHYFIPKVNGLLSFMVNPIFIWITMSDNKLHLGDYRYLLYYFSIVNILCSLCDIMVPMVLHDFEYAFTVFVSGGFFDTDSFFHNFVIGFRCSCISATYAILHSHFLYRFLVVYRKDILDNYFWPYGIIVSIFYTLLHMAYWILVCLFLINADEERREYVRESFFEAYGTNVTEMNMLVALYSEGSAHAVRDSWFGILAITFLSVASVVFLCVLGYLIISNIRKHRVEMSPKTVQLQKQLMRALTAQAIIPTVVSFSPSIFAWYQPVFNVNLGKWLEDLAVIAISIFPYLDPLAIIFFVPVFRKRLADVLVRGKVDTELSTSTRNSQAFGRTVTAA